MKRLRWEWVLCTAVVLVFMVLVESSGVLRRFDTFVYDNLLQLRSRPVSQDIVIVSIDDISLQALGAWPWPRERHAAMLTQLALTKPKAVALDLLFLEHSAMVESDEALAKALRLPDLGAVFLPVTPQTPLVNGRAFSWQKPIAPVSDAVKGFGHINVELDDDGVARGMYVFTDKLQALWPSLSMQLYLASERAQTRNISGSGNAFAMLGRSGNQISLLPFSGSQTHFRTVSFVSVMLGEVPASVFTGKLVLVGVTGTGLGDQYPTPISAQGALVPGVQIVATALEGLLDDSLISAIPSRIGFTLCFIFALVWMILLYPLGPQRSILGLLIAIALAIVMSGIALVYGRVWWPNAALWASMLLGYLLWSWRRVTVMFIDLKLHAKMMAREETPEPPLAIEKPWQTNEWHAILGTLDSGLRTAKLRKKRVTDTLDALPEAVLLTDAMGKIEMANARARKLLKAEKLENQNALPLISKLDESELNPDMSWHSFMNRIKTTLGNGLEVMLDKDLYVLLRTTAIKNLDHNPASDAELDIDDSWWIVMLVDVSKQKQLQRQRNDALQLLWHDLRAPQSAILTLLRTQELTGLQDARSKNDLHDRIGAQVQATLDLADGFVWQLHAESDTLECLEVDIVQLINEVVDRVWPMANAKQIGISCDFSSLQTNMVSEHVKCDAEDVQNEGYLGWWLTVEPSLMRRAIYNLVENAIKYSPMRSEVQIILQLRYAFEESADEPAKKVPRVVEIIVKDEGHGILTANLPRVFDSYTRFSSPKKINAELDTQEPVGYGLGLRLVKTVVEAHKGSVRCTSELGIGSVFTIELPLIQGAL